ncbi:FxsA family protein [uncultured Cocleimonas sp.]|uniref:FxsA family protein n=1 Tax=uncultured Cocleimonas sp. TaxID=1051587 RepID=UPI002639E8AF|nr:FxsA family protein [uncultured Cocleimonas sp.]
MRSTTIFAILFLVIPIAEIYFLIKVGEVIGALPTIILVVLTAVIGAGLLRQQGLSTLARFQQNMSQGKIPAQEMVEGIILAVGGALLMTPGFVTDTIGFLCLLPFSRQYIASNIMKRSAMKVTASMGGFGAGFNGQPGSPFDSDGANADIVEGEYTVVKDGEIHQETIVISNEKKPDRDN